MSERINLTPAVWGPKTWFFLESMAMAYPPDPTDDEKLSAKNLILSLKDLLPCWGCRVNYAKHIDEYFTKIPLDSVVENRGAITEFIIAIHNEVRILTKSKPISVEDTFKYYNKEYSSYVKPVIVGSEEFSQKNQSNTSSVKEIEEFSNPAKLIKSLLYQFNPIMVLIGIVLGLIIYKLFQKSQINDE